MTPIILWGLLTPGVLAAATTVMLAIAAKTATRVWRSTAAGHPGPALIGAAITGAFLYLSYQVMIGAISMPPDGWEHHQITTGWEYYYALAVPALILLWIALLMVFAAEALMAIGAGIAWLDKPSEHSSWGAITNGQRLQRLRRLRANEQRLARAITKRLGPTSNGPLRVFDTSGVLCTERTVGATTISTAFELNVYGTGSELRQAHPGLFDMLDQLIEQPHRLGIESMSLDAGTDAELDVTTPRRRARLHVDWAPEALDARAHSPRRLPVHLRRRPVETAISGADPQ